MGCGASHHRIHQVSQPATRIHAPPKERQSIVPDIHRFKLPKEVLHGLDYILKSVERQEPPQKEEPPKRIIADASPELAIPGYVSKKVTASEERLNGMRTRDMQLGETGGSESRRDEGSLMLSPRSPLPPRVTRSPDTPEVQRSLGDTGPHTQAAERNPVWSDSPRQHHSESIGEMRTVAASVMSK